MRVVDFQSGGPMLFAPELYAILARYQRLIICSAVARLFFDLLCASMTVVVIEERRFKHLMMSEPRSGRTGSGERPVRGG